MSQAPQDQDVKWRRIFDGIFAGLFRFKNGLLLLTSEPRVIIFLPNKTDKILVQSSFDFQSFSSMGVKKPVDVSFLGYDKFFGLYAAGSLFPDMEDPITRLSTNICVLRIGRKDTGLSSLQQLGNDPTILDLLFTNETDMEQDLPCTFKHGFLLPASQIEVRSVRQKQKEKQGYIPIN